MKLLKTIGAVCVFTTLSLTFSAQALAQTTILVVDQARVLRDSKVGKHIKVQLKSISEAMTAELKSQVQPLTSERDRLMNDLKNISVDALKARPDLQQRAKSLKEKVGKSQMEEAYKQRELQITEQKSLGKVHEKLTGILKNLVKERNADIILDRSLVIYSGSSNDVTDTVISRLNSQMSRVTVKRERLPRKTK